MNHICSKHNWIFQGLAIQHWSLTGIPSLVEQLNSISFPQPSWLYHWFFAKLLQDFSHPLIKLLVLFFSQPKHHDFSAQLFFYSNLLSNWLDSVSGNHCTGRNCRRLHNITVGLADTGFNRALNSWTILSSMLIRSTFSVCLSSVCAYRFIVFIE